jgi:hypothetical protein
MVTLITLCLGACTRTTDTQPTSSAQTPPLPFFIKTTIREIMDAEVDPAADALWDSVSFTSSLTGPEEKQPRTPQEWHAVRRNAITLLEATNLIVMEGRRIAPANVALTPGELNPAALQRKLDANRAQFLGFAQALRGLMLQTLDAIDAKDSQRLFELGGEIDAACESCHLAYWYPAQRGGG